MTKIKNVSLPIAYDCCTKIDNLTFLFIDVEFTENFKDIKKGQTFSSVCIDYNIGEFKVYTKVKTEKVLHNYKLNFT